MSSDRSIARLTRWTFGLVVVVSIAGAVAGGAASRALDRDHTAPSFKGLMSAVTCSPGPVGGGATSRYRLSWDAATDDRSPSSRIVYDVYQATASGGEDFSSPTYTTPRGATSFDTPPLPADKTFFFVVRARDRAGNTDANVVERQGVNLCV